MRESNLSCLEEQRREDVRAASLYGFDHVEVTDASQTTLNVFFLGKAPQNIEKANIVLSGGRRIRDVRITSVRLARQSDPTLDDYVEVRVNKPGDFSEYTLSAVNVNQGQPTGQPMDGFDSRYARVCFQFKAGCPTDLDCKPQCGYPPPHRQQPEINYLAKDYSSFRQLILDRLALIMPEWTETHAPDLGITLVELLAYAGDYLSYYQDAVATEAYLGTARQRISVRRHARLVDYFMHEGCDARAWITLQTQTDQPLDPKQVFFITPYPGSPAKTVLSLKDIADVPASSYEVFEPLYWNGGSNIAVYAAHSEILFYTWGDCECCLAPGSTTATLLDAWEQPTQVDSPSPDPTEPGSPSPTLAAKAKSPKQAAAPAAPARDVAPEKLRKLRNLKPGDILIFEEVLGPKSGKTTDADPRHRQAVRLTKVAPGIDPLYGQPDGTPIVEIEWASEDALKFTLCISSQRSAPDCRCRENVSVARGNVILVDHGAASGETLGIVPTDSTTAHCPKCCEPAEIAVSSGLFRPVLGQTPLTFSVPLPTPCSAIELIRQDPRQALPWISLKSIPPAPACADPLPEPQPPCEAQPLFSFADLDDPRSLAESLQHPATASRQALLAQLSSSTQQQLAAWDGSFPLPDPLLSALLGDLNGLVQTWTPKLDLLESLPNDRDFVVEVDNNGFGHLRFGDGVCGYRPDAGTLFRATYRIGNGKVGNVGAETITYSVFRQQAVSGVDLSVSNPLPARGGTDPEPIDNVKLFAPYAFRDQLERAITADDYASLAQDNQRRLETRAALEAEDPEICAARFTRLQRAKAALRWTGSWYAALVAIDPAGSEVSDSELITEITDYLEPFRRMGHDLLVSPAEYVPLKLSLTVCVLPGYLRAHVEAAVTDALSNRVLPDGSLGFFHPDNLTFGDGVYVSQILARVQAIPGVQNALVTELERFEISEPESGDQPGEELPMNSALTLGPFEIAQLDNDPNFPEHGTLVLDMRGGR
jgi:hypothetical protein